LRIELAMRENQKEIPVTYVDLSESEEAEILATLDPLSALAFTDKEKLDELLREVHASDKAVTEMLARLAEKELGYFVGVDGIEAPQLRDGDRQPFQQMTFTLHDTQAETIKKAMEKARENGGGKSGVNENGNGNALAFVCEAFIG
jgi:hypothetical protein